MSQGTPSAKATITRDVALGQISFAVFIAICVALHPGLVLKSNEGGLSNYGVHAKTVVPYTLALALAAGFTLRAARSASLSTSARRLERLLNTYALLTLLTLVTTYGYTLNKPFKDLHVGVGVVITVFEFVASLWMYREIKSLHFVFAAGLVGFALAIVTFFGALHVLFLTQLLIGGAFALLLIRTSREPT
ncbi:MAG TPA: hypothetical protein VND89_00445 [Acidimicrobiales bacterium]|nr:hypothetical protein [Acidimicrobiales bacterium]